MRVLVTGGLGYVGGHLVRALAQRGDDVLVLDNAHNARRWEFGPGVACMLDSVTNADAVARALRGVVLVYHLAARADYQPGCRHSVRLYNTNVLGTATLLAAARCAGVDRVVVASCYHVYGDVVEATEDGPCAPLNAHGCSKLAQEAVCREYANYGLNVVVLRLFSVWGGAHCRSVLGRIARGEDVALYGDGNQTRDFVHIRDVRRALLLAAGWDSGVYNVGTGVETSLNGLWRMLRADAPHYTRPPLGYEEAERCCAATERAAAAGWTAQYKLGDLAPAEVRRLASEEA